MANHDYSKVFDTDNELWQRVLEIYEANEKYPKKIVSGRNLHHKFPRSFSKKLGEDVDNDKDNMVSLSLSDHFLIHYYYYKLARTGYKQSMAMAFSLMAKKQLKYISADTAESMAKDYEEALKLKSSPSQYQKDQSAKAQRRPEVRAKKSKSMKGKNAGTNNGMYGKHSAMKGHSCTDWMTEEEIDRWKEAMSKSLTGRVKSEEECKNIAKSKLGYRNPMSSFRRKFREIYPDYDYLKDNFQFFDREYEYYCLNGKFSN